MTHSLIMAVLTSIPKSMTARGTQKGELTTNAEKREADLKDWSRSAATATAAATAAATPHPGTPSTSHQRDTAQQSE